MTDQKEERGMTTLMTGQIVTASFEDGLERGPDCGLEDCDCPEHEVSPRPAGTYVTVRLDDGDLPIGLWRVEIRRASQQPAPTEDERGIADEQIDRFLMGPHVHRQYRARATLGHVAGEERLSPDAAIQAYEEALDRETFEQPDETPLVESRLVTPWVAAESTRVPNQAIGVTDD